MNSAFVENWNSVVGRKDRVFIVGDFAFKRHARWVNMLHGKKILICGNHDEMNQDSFRMFTLVHKFGWSGIINGKEVTLCHYPMISWDNACKGAWHFHGHSHQRLNDNEVKAVTRYGLMMDVGVDGWDYKPVPFEVLAERMKEKEAYLKNSGKNFKG